MSKKLSPYSSVREQGYFWDLRQQPRKRFATGIWLQAILTAMTVMFLVYITVEQHALQVATASGPRTSFPDTLMINGVPYNSENEMDISHMYGTYNLESYIKDSTMFQTTLEVSSLQGILNVTLVPPQDLRNPNRVSGLTPTTRRSERTLMICTLGGLPRDKIFIVQDVSFKQTWNSNGQRKCRKYLGHICSLIYTSAYIKSETSSTYVYIPEKTNNTSLPDFTTLYIDIYDTDLKVVNNNFATLLASDSIYINAQGNSSVSTGTLSSEQITIKSGHGPIMGTFNTTSMLQLSTSNAPIIIKANLKSKGWYFYPGIVATTSNSPIEATVNFFGSEQSVFAVKAETVNSHINLKFPIAPLNNIASIDARTTNGAVTVDTHPTFQGTFYLSTTNSTALIDQSRKTQDPSGQGRSRQLEYSWYSEEKTAGRVYWSKIKRKYESYGVYMQTTNAPAVLVL